MGVDCVVVAPAVSLARYLAGDGKLGDDAMCGAFGDPDAVAEVTQATTGIVGDMDQDLGVIGQEAPMCAR